MSEQKLPGGTAATRRRVARIVPEMTRERRRERLSLPSQKTYRCAHQKILMRQRLCDFIACSVMRNNQAHPL